MGAVAESVTLAADGGPPWIQEAAWRLGDVVASLGPGALAELDMHNVRLSPAGLQALGQLRQLRHLRLFTDGSALSYRDLIASVSQLERLQAFRFLGAFVDSSLVAALCHLRQLSALELQSFEGPLPDLSPLTALAGTLTELGAVERQGGDSRRKIPPVQLEPFFRFRKLDQLVVGGRAVKVR